MKPIFTPKLDGKSLCVSCRYASRVEGQKLSECLTRCSIHRGYITFPVTQCSDYEDKSTPTLTDMYQQAWKITTDKKAQKAGFKDTNSVKILDPDAFKAKLDDDDVALTPFDEEHRWD